MEKKYSAIILLGGFVSEDEKGNGFFNDASIRYFTAVRLLKVGKAGRIIFTGGNGNLHPDKFKEADFVKTRLKEAGVPDSLVLLEDNARNTEENAKFSKVILQRRDLKAPYLLVTSDYHMRRAALIFKRQGLNVVPHPCDNLKTKIFEMEDIIPNIEAIMQWNVYIKEVIGYVVALVR
ncbi:MAG: YdcF family protein [Mucilaginibacter sp.]|nr:YdcF family protein [Mucilaginibacter sp.]